MGPTQPPIQWVPGSLSLRVKRSGREADHSPPSSAEVKERVELYLHAPNKPSWRGAQLNHKENSILPLPNRVNKSNKMRWKGHIARKVEMINAYKLFVGISEGNIQLGRPTRRCEDNIKTDLK
jgi:hypothetical protein